MQHVASFSLIASFGGKADSIQGVPMSPLLATSGRYAPISVSV